MSDRLAYVTRGGIVESEHRGVIAVSDPEGRCIARQGDVGLVTFARSSAKPVQAIPLVESGAADALGLTEQEIALCCGSHSSEPLHTDGALSILRKAGLDESHLRCGTHMPHTLSVYDALVRTGEALSPRFSNCSGKHAGMLACAVHLGYDPATYLEPSHPLQRRIVQTLGELAAVGPDEIVQGTDGCGVPTFALSMERWARVFAQFARPQGRPHGEAMARLSAAMRAHPRMVAGEGRFDTELMAASGGRLMVKGGAEGFIAVAAPEQGFALVVKMRDGNERGIYPVVVAALRALGALSDEACARLEHRARPQLHNTRGDVIGEVVADVALA